jgi:uncharacterized OsmC-like protein
MEITARVNHRAGEHRVVVTTDGKAQAVAVAAKSMGSGSAINGGEFLMLALATCYCNDLYREAAALGMQLNGVEVEAYVEFEGVALAARKVRYCARVDSPESATRIEALLARTDVVAEIHNTLRAGAIVVRELWRAS